MASGTEDPNQDQTYQNVTVERDGPVAVVTYDRGAKLNAFDQTSILELTDVARRFRDDLSIRAVVLAGSASAFSAGIDLTDAATWEPLEDDVALRARFARGVRLCQAWEEMPQITVAAMEKMSVGAGAAIALACDWRVLAEDGFLYVPEVKVGLNLQWGALPRLITLVGPARAKRIVLLCEKLGAQQSLEWGLVDELAPSGGSVEVARGMAEAGGGPPPPAGPRGKGAGETPPPPPPPARAAQNNRVARQRVCWITVAV
ncbi:MAG: enoyl-CoA hydratase/isomerase family protein [Actinomycetota bacterium]